ncbi:MAG: hypothetical protein J5585_01980 [Clostridia bacterium]|nr:hypothetical protein [Clostridia bacterium]
MKLDPIFSDGVIFAENRPVRVFGEGDGPVTVRLCGAEKTVMPQDGRWLAELPAMSAGGPYTLTVCCGGERAVINDVYVGIVYLLAGQSNAEFTLGESSEPESNYECDPLLRNHFVKRPWLDPDVFGADDGWRAARADTVARWSAIAYLAGRETRRLTGKAVGVVSCYQGASVIESWLPKNVADGFRLADSELMIDHYYKDYSTWNGNGVIYEKMLSPLAPFSFCGVIWYQGESDTSVPEGRIYDAELCRFMRTVRSDFMDPGLRFAVIQIADYDQRREYDPEGWKIIQRAQALAVDADGLSSLVVSADVCESTCIHPTHKTELSVRAAKALLD